MSGLNGDNVAGAQRGDAAGTTGRRCSSISTRVPLDAAADAAKPFRMPVQWVNRPDQRFPRLRRARSRAGAIAPGDAVRDPAVGPDDAGSRGSSPLDGDLDEAVAGQSVTLTLADEVDCSRGDVIAAAERSAARPPTSSKRRSCGWPTSELLPGRGYWLKLGTQTVTATVQHPKYEINVNTLEHLAAPRRWS